MLTKSQIAAVVFGVLLVVIAIILGICAALGLFSSKKDSRTSNKTLISNSYVFFASGDWKHWDSRGVVKTGKDCQKLADFLYNAQEFAEFDEGRVLIMLAPGRHTLHLRLGYYTQVIGIGSDASKTVVVGSIEVPNSAEPLIGALNNFFRSVQNLTIEVKKDDGDTKNYFRASQASPIRNLKVYGDLHLAEFQQAPPIPPSTEPNIGGFSSGGFMANVEVTGKVDYETQQQFFSRNGNFSSGLHGSWNIVYAGCVGEVEETACQQSSPLVSETPTVVGWTRSVPRLNYNESTNVFSIVLPGAYKNSAGLLPTDKDVILTNIFIATSATTVEEINENLDEGVHVVLSPFVYRFSKPIRVTRSGTVLMGAGFAAVMPTQGNIAVEVVDGAVGVVLSSFMIEAGSPYGPQASLSPALLRVGDTVNSTGDSENPTYVMDVFPRVGGPTDTAAAVTMIEINQKHVVIDHIWCWRADHDKSGAHSGLGVDKAVAQHGLVVNADNVVACAVFAEHTLQEPVLWNGNDGVLTFMQCELAYDVVAPFDVPGLRVTGSGFTGSYIGIYSFFAKKWNDSIGKLPPQVKTAIVAPDDSKIEFACTVFLNDETGAGSILSVINGGGPKSSAANSGLPAWCGAPAANVCTACPMQTTKRDDF